MHGIKNPALHLFNWMSSKSDYYLRPKGSRVKSSAWWLLILIEDSRCFLQPLQTKERTVKQSAATSYSVLPSPCLFSRSTYIDVSRSVHNDPPQNCSDYYKLHFKYRLPCQHCRRFHKIEFNNNNNNNNAQNKNIQ